MGAGAIVFVVAIVNLRVKYLEGRAYSTAPVFKSWVNTLKISTNGSAAVFPTLRCWSSLIRTTVQLLLRQCELYYEHPATQCPRRPVVHGGEPIVITQNRGVACSFARRAGVHGGVGKPSAAADSSVRFGPNERPNGIPCAFEHQEYML